MARPEDAPRLAECAPRVMASWNHHAALLDQSGDEMSSDEEGIACWKIWVAEIRSQLVGMIALSTVIDSAQIEELKIEREFQRMGVARALMDAAVDECCQCGITSIALAADPNAEPIYWKLGFATVGYTAPGSISSGALRRMVRPVFEPAI